MADDIDIKVKPFQTYPRASGIAGDEISLGSDWVQNPTCKYPMLKYRNAVMNTNYQRTFKNVTGVRSIKDRQFGRDALVLQYHDAYYDWMYGGPEYIKRLFGVLKFVPLVGAHTYEACGGDAGNWHLLPFSTRTSDEYLITRSYSGTSPIEYGFLPAARKTPPNFTTSFLLPALRPTEISQELHDNFRLYMIFLYLSSLDTSQFYYWNLRFDLALYLRYPAYPGITDFVPLASVDSQWTIAYDTLAISGSYVYSWGINSNTEVEIFPLLRTNTYLWGYNVIWLDNMKSYFGVIRLN